jgi:hypothetical protein
MEKKERIIGFLNGVLNAQPAQKVKGSARILRAGCGVAPKRTFAELTRGAVAALKEFRDREDALANTRNACAPQNSLPS